MKKREQIALVRSALEAQINKKIQLEPGTIESNGAAAV